MDFWKMAYKLGWASLEQLRMAVITPENPFGDITPEQFEEISGEKFDKAAEEPVEEPVE